MAQYVLAIACSETKPTKQLNDSRMQAVDLRFLSGLFTLLLNTLFDFTLRGRNPHNAFIDMGDQFVQLRLGDTQEADAGRHFGFVVDNREPVREALLEMGVELLERGLNFRDPWGNRVEVVPYDDIQFTKAAHVLRGMGITDLDKTPEAIAELSKKGMDPDG